MILKGSCEVALPGKEKDGNEKICLYTLAIAHPEFDSPKIKV